MGVLQISSAQLGDFRNPFSNLHIFHHQSDTLCAVFEDEQMTNMRANPIQSDAAGDFGSIFLAEGSYDARLVDTDGNVVAFVENTIVETSSKSGTLEFSTPAAIIGDDRLAYTAGIGIPAVVAGDVVTTRYPGFSYRVLAENSSDAHLVTQSGVKLAVLPGEDGAVNIAAWGVVGDGVADDSGALQ